MVKREKYTFINFSLIENYDLYPETPLNTAVIKLNLTRMNNQHGKDRNPRLGLISLGCPKNTVDSERLMGDLAGRGWEFTDEISDADCLVVNTCGFLDSARLESEEAIREICEAKKTNPEVLLVATGCMPQNVPGILEEKFPALDMVVGVGNLADLPAMIHDFWRNKSSRPLRRGWELSRPGRATLSDSSAPRLRLTSPWTAYMKISEGCDHECSFCTIPAIKGKHRSRPVDDLVEEARMLADDGVREIIIVSQDTTHYGSDIGTNLRNLLVELDKVEGIDWIRLHYLYPGKITDNLLDVIADSGHILPYFDIPIQHADPGVLRSMNRIKPDTDLLDMLDDIRDKFRNSSNPACIRTTLITGFPGETEEQFVRCLEFIEQARIDRLTVFQYSNEPGTASYSLPDQVPEHESENRMHTLMEAQMEISLEINEGWIGENIEVLIEGETDDGRRAGRSYRDSPEIDGLVLAGDIPDEVTPGNLVKVRVTGALPYDLEAVWDPTLQ